ncbi:hypothetical protein D3C86_1771970 [compost metagenome]
MPRMASSRPNCREATTSNAPSPPSAKNVIFLFAGESMPMGMKPMMRATTAAVVIVDVADCDARRL